jgi:hypothetical protein
MTQPAETRPPRKPDPSKIADLILWILSQPKEQISPEERAELDKARAAGTATWSDGSPRILGLRAWGADGPPDFDRPARSAHAKGLGAS